MEPMSPSDLSRELALSLYTTMVRIRAFETRTERLFLDGKLPGFLHLYIGEEAIAAGVCRSLTQDDYIVSTHRGHGHSIAKGASLGAMMAEIYGKATGVCHGKGGSMHIADFGVGMLGANGVVGGGFPIAAGAGLSVRLRRTAQVVVCFFGDGASNRGTFHEALNVASAWRLPVVFVCENNGFGSTTPYSAVTGPVDESGRDAPWPVHSLTRVSDRAAAYGMPGWTVDGNDVMQVFEAAAVAVQRARAGEGPSLLECLTYRIKGHYVGDPEKYRSKAEVEGFWAKEPVARFRQSVLSSDLVSQEEFDRADTEARGEVERAVAFAEASPWPEPEAALADLYT